MGRGYTIRRFANEVLEGAIDPVMLGYIEKGQRFPNEDLVRRLATIREEDPQELLALLWRDRMIYAFARELRRVIVPGDLASAETDDPDAGAGALEEATFAMTESPLAELEVLPLDMIKIVHFKQMGGGETHLSVDDGDLDCRKMRDILDAKGYTGAAIMEIPSDAGVFDNLEASFQYLS